MKNKTQNEIIILLKEAVEHIAGKNALGIIELLLGKKNVNEFIIAKKLGLTINQTRNIIYKLSDKGIISSIRKKDKRKGWYTYFWTLDLKKTLLFLQANLEKEIAQLEHQLKSRQTRRFFICKQCNIEVSEENALTNNFTCGECGEVYELSSSKKTIDVFESRKARLEKELKIIGAEIEEINKKIQKSIEAKERRIKKEKEKERRKRAEAKKRVAKKEARKKGKEMKEKKGMKKKTSKKVKEKVVKEKKDVKQTKKTSKKVKKKKK